MWRASASTNRSSPPARLSKGEACQPAYQVQKLAGMFWAYMGPSPAPLLPRWEPLVSTKGPRSIYVLPQLQCNWLQIMENSVDTTHTYYLHGHMMVTRGQAEQAAYYYRPIEDYDFEVVKEDTWAGVRKIRTYGGEMAEKELGHPLIFPCILLSPQREHIVMHFRLPIDDTHTQIYRIEYTPGGDTSGMDWDNPPVRYSKSLKDENGEFKLDTFASQDAMAWETQGPVLDRSLENLGTSDRGLTLYRRMLKEQIVAVQEGKEPLGVDTRSEEESDDRHSGVGRAGSDGAQGNAESRLARKREKDRWEDVKSSKGMGCRNIRSRFPPR